MRVIGLTGGIASGKTTASDYIAQFGVPIIDADIINKNLLQPEAKGYKEILQAFPEVLLKPNGELDKLFIRDLIFNNSEKKTQFETILHPLIKESIKDQINSLTNKNHHYCIVSVPLLIEANFQHLVDEIWVIDCPQEVQIERLILRDSISNKQAMLILKQQLNSETRKSFATNIINSLDLKKMKQHLEKLHQQQLLLNS